MKIYLAIILVFLITPSGYGQSPGIEEPPKEVIRGRAIKLGRPAYPPEASMKRIRGSVNVQVIVDEDGNVISAKALTGNSIFHRAAEAAALESKFSQTFVDGKRTQVKGTIVFNFIKYTNWEEVGSTLATLQKGTAAIVTGAQVSNDVVWVNFDQEKEEYFALQKDENVPNRVLRATKLTNTLRIKLKSLEPTELWYFNLGYATSLLANSASNEVDGQQFYFYLKELAKIINIAPNGIPEERLIVLRKVAKLSELQDMDKAQRTGIVSLIVNDRNSFLNSNQ